MQKFHGEYLAKIRADVVVYADNIEDAQKAVKDLHIDIDDTERVTAEEWDVEGVAVYLFNKDE